MNPNDWLGLAGVPLIVALVEALKAAFPALPARFYPFVSMAVGIVLNLVLTWILGGDYRTAAIVGMAAGLGAAGLFSWSKAREIGGQ